jgi:hypothetical protein
MPKMPKIKDVNHFIKRVLISGYPKANLTGFTPPACKPYSQTRRARVYEPEAGLEGI